MRTGHAAGSLNSALVPSSSPPGFARLAAHESLFSISQKDWNFVLTYFLDPGSFTPSPSQNRT